MSRSTLNAEIREEKGNNHHLRNENRIPAVVYGGGEGPVLLSLSQAETDRFLNSHHVGSTLDLSIGEEASLVLLREIQQHPVSRKVQHMDFQRLRADEKIKVTIPIFLTGLDDVQDVIIQELQSELEIEAFPRHLVDSIAVDVSGAEVGVSLSVADLPIAQDENYTIHTPMETLIYNAIEPTTFEEPVDEEAEEALEGEVAEEAAEGEEAPAEEE